MKNLRRVIITMEVDVHPEGRAGDIGAILVALCEATEMGPAKLYRMGMATVHEAQKTK